MSTHHLDTPRVRVHHDVSQHQNDALKYQSEVIGMDGTTLRLPLATPKEVAGFRRTSEANLAQERYKGTGPRFKKLGKRVYYDWADVYEWVDSNTYQRTDDRPESA